MTKTVEQYRSEANAILYGLSRRTCSLEHALSHAEEVVLLLKQLIKDTKNDPSAQWIGDSDTRRARRAWGEGAN